MAKYRKKPVVIEAFQWTGGPDQIEDPPWIVDALRSGVVHMHSHETGIRMCIKTLEGTMHADIGDFVIRGIKGELYPCKPDIFEATYEKVEASDD